MMRAAPADAAERHKAIHERARNVIVDAGAGTGKTTLLIARLLRLLAPQDDAPALELERVVAITFTRKAAGELKLRLREALLSALSAAELSELRRQRLSRALSALDNAAISTVHSFADRLLRLRPADAGISPSYEILEDPRELIDETTAWLLAAAHSGELAAEAADTVRTFQGSGLRVYSEQLEHVSLLGLDSFVRDVIETRDRPIVLPDVPVYEPGQVEHVCHELSDALAAVKLKSRGSALLSRLLDHAYRIPACDDFGEALRVAVRWSRELPQIKQLQRGDDFESDPTGWGVLTWIRDGHRGAGKKREERRGGPLAAALTAPLYEVMAKRLVRLRPHILAHYSELKRAHGVLDHIDLLIKLRDVLAENHEARAFYQTLFDHVLVDEFQDTDPLQAEIVLYLCEAGAHAQSLAEVQPAPGKLTVVGDPKQSIYRFRRADIALYAEVCERLRRGGACEARLTVNFRSAPAILSWLNAGFDSVLGRQEQGPQLDAQAGTVRNLPLTAADERQVGGVQILPFGDDELKADASRDLEGEALARYIRYLVEESELQITDVRTRSSRRPRYADVAVMMIATQTVHHLLSELDRSGVPHVVRGGTLFMQDPLHQQFVLGLRALSDGGDGVARAALMRPPFFAVSLEDLARARQLGEESPEFQAAQALRRELRQLRNELTPGEMARRVLEQTGFGRFVAAGVNGAQRLARLYALCAALDEQARSRGLDFDEVTALARSWIDTPPQLEAPLPIDADAVQVITAHQAKGLEWPIVALWDGRAGWRAFLPQVAFTVDAVSGAWALQLDGLRYDPSERALHKRESELRAAERKRVAYVAATRARDWLIVPEAGAAHDTHITGQLIQAGSAQPHERVARYDRAGRGWWERAVNVSMRPVSAPAPRLPEAWLAGAQRARLPWLAPLAITSHAHRVDVGLDDDAELAPREGRFGPLFGSTVHRALQLALERNLSAQLAVERAAQATGLGELLDEALADVLRTLASLRAAGLLQDRLCLEYPVAAALDSESLLAGSIDLLVIAADSVSVIDFKTDQPPDADVERQHPGYVQQVRTYARLIERAQLCVGRELRQALLFTADGQLHWV